MKKILYIIPFLLCFGNAFTQSTPEFAFQLYFEDAVGNKDTVTLGYDPMATDSIDTTFGEADIISQAWDTSGLDVRIGNKTYLKNNWLSTNTYLTKKQILGSFCSNWLKRSDTISIQFNLDHLPIKMHISIQKTANLPNAIFQCIQTSSFFGKYYPTSPDAYMGITLGMIDSSSHNPILLIDIDSSLNILTGNGIELNNYNINNKGIGVLQFFFWGGGTAELTKERKYDFQIYPNPNQSEFTVKIPKTINPAKTKLKLFSIDGRLIREIGLFKKKQKITLENMKRGIYILKFENLDREITQIKKLLIE